MRSIHSRLRIYTTEKLVSVGFGIAFVTGVLLAVIAQLLPNWGKPLFDTQPLEFVGRLVIFLGWSPVAIYLLVLFPDGDLTQADIKDLPVDLRRRANEWLASPPAERLTWSTVRGWREEMAAEARKQRKAAELADHHRRLRDASRESD